MNIAKMAKAAAFAGCVSIFSLAPATGNAAIQTRTVNVVRVRTMPNGETHLIIGGGALGGTCGSYLRVTGTGTDRVISAATAALLSGRAAEIEYNDAISGNYCDLTKFNLI